MSYIPSDISGYAYRLRGGYGPSLHMLLARRRRSRSRVAVDLVTILNRRLELIRASLEFQTLKRERRQELSDVVEMPLVLIATVKADRFGFVLLTRRFIGETGTTRSLRHFLNKLADFELDRAQRSVFGEVLIIHHLEKKGLLESVYWCINNLIPTGVKICQKVSIFVDGLLRVKHTVVHYLCTSLNDIVNQHTDVRVALGKA